MALIDSFNSLKDTINKQMAANNAISNATGNIVLLNETINSQISNYISTNRQEFGIAVNATGISNELKIAQSKSNINAITTIDNKKTIGNAQIENYKSSNEFTNDKTFGWGLPGGLSKVDFKAYLNWAKLNLNELKNNPYKIGMILGFQIPFYLMNPSWREGQIFNPLKMIANAVPLIGGTELIPHALDLIASPGHTLLAQQREDMLSTYRTESMAGINKVHGVFDTPSRIDSTFPFVHIGMPFAESSKHPFGVSIEKFNKALNANSVDAPTTMFQPISQDNPPPLDAKGKGDYYASIYNKREYVGLPSADIYLAMQKNPKRQIKRKDWQNDFDSWGEYFIMDTKDISLNIPLLYLPILLTDLRTNQTAIFKPYIKKINQDFQPNWNIQEYFNRSDSIATYKNTRRNLTLDLMLVATSDLSMMLMREKMSFIENLVYPKYNRFTAQFVSAPVCRLRIADLINVNIDEYQTAVQWNTPQNFSSENTKILSELGCPAIITSLSYDYNETFPWHISEELKTLNVIGVSMTFILLHDYQRGVHESSEERNKEMESLIREQQKKFETEAPTTTIILPKNDDSTLG